MAGVEGVPGAVRPAGRVAAGRAAEREQVAAAGWRLVPLAVTLLAFGLRAFRLGFQELRGDEVYGYMFSQMSFLDLFRNTILWREPHPVGSYIVEKAALALIGGSEFALRFAAAWWGVLTVALIYAVARRLRYSKPLAALAAALLAASPYAIWHSQDARMYSMLLALTLASTWLALVALERRRPGPLAAYVAVTLLALHTHYSAAFVVVAQDVFVVIRWWRRSRGRGVPELARGILPWLAGQIALALLYAPWLWLAGPNLVSYNGNGESPGLPAMLWRSFSALAAGESLPLAVRPWFALLVAALLAYGIYRLARRGLATATAGSAFLSRAETAWFLAIWLLLPLAANWASGLNRPIFSERYLVTALPACCLLLAVAIRTYPPVPLSDTRRRGRLSGFSASMDDGVTPPSSGEGPGERSARANSRLAWVGAVAALALAAAVVLSLANYYANPYYSKTRGWRDLAAGLHSLGDGLPPAEVRVIQNYPDPTQWYYYPGPAQALVLPPAANDAAGAQAEVAKMAASGVTWAFLVHLPTETFDPHNVAQAALAGQYILAGERRLGDWPVQVFIRSDRATLRPLAAAFADGVSLPSALVEPGTVRPGGILVVRLAFAGQADRLAGSEKLFIHVADAAGRPATQVDVPFDPAWLNGDVLTFPMNLPADMAAGIYQVRVGLYDPDQPGAPRVSLADGADHALAGEIEVPEK